MNKKIFDALVTINGLGLNNIGAMDRILCKVHGIRLRRLILPQEASTEKLEKYLKLKKIEDRKIEMLEELRSKYIEMLRNYPLTRRQIKIKIRVKVERGKKVTKTYDGFNNTKQKPKPKPKQQQGTPRQRVFTTPEKYRTSPNLWVGSAPNAK